MKTMTLGYSPCPNDTFIFHGLVHGLVETPGLLFRERLEDVETLNRLVLAGELDVSKISYHLLGHVRDHYFLLRAGGALGRGCGPLVVARKPLRPETLRDLRVAVPGRHTTAALLLRLFDHRIANLAFMPFHEIMSAVRSGAVDAGVIIHESRFTYRDFGMVEILDLGRWWEEETGHPIPLGGIVARRSLGREMAASLNKALKESVAAAFANPSRTHDYIRTHSQELSEDVCAAHIALYVNTFSEDLGQEGVAAVEELLARAESAEIIPRSKKNLFVP